MIANPELWIIWISKLFAKFGEMRDSDQTDYFALQNNFFANGIDRTLYIYSKGNYHKIEIEFRR